MFSNLAWLPPPPRDFRDQVRRLKVEALSGNAGETLWRRTKALALHVLDEVQLGQIAAVVRALPAGSGAPPVRKLGLLGDGTLSLLGPAIVASCLRQDLRVEIVEGDYGSAVNDAVDPNSRFRRAAPDLALVASDRRGLGLSQSTVSAQVAARAVDMAVATLRSICEGLEAFVPGTIIVQTLAPPLEPYLGSFDARFSGSAASQVAAFNARLRDLAEEKGYALMDVARLAGAVGLEAWDDPQQWHAAKLPFAAGMVPAYADLVARTLGAVHGKSRKCLVIDLDNTIWGGVIGDDGVTGIVLGQGSAAGEAFLAIQQTVLSLRDRGVVIAVSSKNEEANARAPFRNHPEMILKEDHIAVFRANWVDKAANLKAIAESLNIGLDALVFLDDNPAERAQVRAELPMVAVPELPDNPALYPRALLAAGYFEAVAFNDDDRRRADDYQANSGRETLRAQASNLEDYLKSLDMICSIKPFNGEGRARVAQLINKSNQYNLTTRRYTEPEVARVEADPAKLGLQIRLADRFGDNGVISVVIADKSEDAWTIDTWLMSCRVLGRRVQEAVLRYLVAEAKRAGVASIHGVYIPSAKNGMVADHYPNLGFRAAGAEGAGTRWTLDVNAYLEPKLPMTIEEQPVEETA